MVWITYWRCLAPSSKVNGITQSVSKENWDDVAESWFALVALYDELRGERSRIVLAEILSRRGLALSVIVQFVGTDYSSFHILAAHFWL